MSPDERLEANLLKNGEVLIFGEIDESTPKEVIPRIRYINKFLAKDKPLLIYIYSNGGVVEAACAIADEIKIVSRDREVYTIGMGQVASAAIYILIAGTRRFGYEYTQYMMHPYAYACEEAHQQNKESVLFADRFYNGLMMNIAIACGKKDAKDIKKFLLDVQKSLWFDTESAIEFKLIEGQWPIDEKGNERGV